jgi:hypothetical protein
MDELCALLSALKEGEVTETEVIKCLSNSLHWVWVAMAPVSKLILTVEVGERTLAMAPPLVHQVTAVLVSDGTPLFLPDGFRESFAALDATPSALLCSGRQILSASTHCGAQHRSRTLPVHDQIFTHFQGADGVCPA